MPDPYGTPIGSDNAKKAAAAALAEARRNGWTMAAAVTDTGGHLVYFEKMDGTQTGSVAVAIGKARSAALFMRPTKAFQDVLAGGGDGLRVLGLDGAVPVEGGVPLVVAGKIVGAIGLSGGASSQDGQCARAGADALK
jgi:glc operon protein GlcG